MPLAYLPNPEGVDLRLTIRGMPGAEADRQLEQGAARLFVHAPVGRRLRDREAVGVAPERAVRPSVRSSPPAGPA